MGTYPRLLASRSNANSPSQNLYTVNSFSTSVRPSNLGLYFLAAYNLSSSLHYILLFKKRPLSFDMEVTRIVCQTELTTTTQNNQIILLQNELQSLPNCQLLLTSEGKESKLTVQFLQCDISNDHRDKYASVGLPHIKGKRERYTVGGKDSTSTKMKQKEKQQITVKILEACEHTIFSCNVNIRQLKPLMTRSTLPQAVLK